MVIAQLIWYFSQIMIAVTAKTHIALTAKTHIVSIQNNFLQQLFWLKVLCKSVCILVDELNLRNSKQVSFSKISQHDD